MSTSPISRVPARRTITAVAVAAVVALAAPAAGSAAAGPDAGSGFRQAASAPTDLRVVGITPNGRLVRFTVAHPRQLTVIGTVSGLVGDTRLIGIDFRVQDGKLYGVGDLGGVYVLNRSTARATRVSQLTVLPEGTSFGVDFNPAADRLRIVSDTGQNLRHDVNPGGTTTVDGVLSYVPPTPATGISMAAYTNNDLSTQTGTSLFDIDTSLNQVALQAPANNGSLGATGSLGRDVGPGGGLDIYSRLDDAGVTSSVVALASLRPAGEARSVYSVDLLTGRLTNLGEQRRRAPLADLAIPLDQG